MLLMGIPIRKPWKSTPNRINMKLKNKRNYCRFQADLKASYMLFKHWYDCTILDISEKGASLKTKQIFVRGDTLKLNITNGNRSVTLLAEVIHHSGIKTGILFNVNEGEKIKQFNEIVTDVLKQKIKSNKKLLK